MWIIANNAPMPPVASGKVIYRNKGVSIYEYQMQPQSFNEKEVKTSPSK